MPTILLIDGYRFFFFSNENNEPAHIHVEKAEAVAKWWLDPVREEWSVGFSPRQRKYIRTIVSKKRAEFLERWNEYFETGQ